jgi:hypothetical protein
LSFAGSKDWILFLLTFQLFQFFIPRVYGNNMSSITSLDQLVKQPINSKTTRMKQILRIDITSCALLSNSHLFLLCPFLSPLVLVIDMLRKAIRCTTKPIENSFSRRRTSPLCEVLKSNNTPYVPPLSIFVKELIRRSNVSTGTVIVSLVYIERLQKKLPEATQGEINRYSSSP